LSLQRHSGLDYQFGEVGSEDKGSGCLIGALSCCLWLYDRWKFALGASISLVTRSFYRVSYFKNRALTAVAWGGKWWDIARLAGNIRTNASGGITIDAVFFPQANRITQSAQVLALYIGQVWVNIWYYKTVDF